MAASIRELAQLGPMSPIGYGEGEDALLSPSPLSPGFPPGALSVDGRDDDSIWNWNNDVEKEREGERQSGELMFNHPSDVSAIDTDEEEAFARRNEFMDGMSEEDIYDESVRKEYSVEEERKVVRKFDLHLTLFMAVLYMLSFLDRSNIGNAKVAGLESDLQLSSNGYEWALSAFYFTYMAFEWMTLQCPLDKGYLL